MTLALTLLLLILSSKLSVGIRHCDEDLCQPVVDECLSVDRCQCDFKNDAICAKDCIDCLENNFGKCCACVGLCPAIESQLHTSHVGDTSASDEQLFRVLTETDDIKGRWTVHNLTNHEKTDSSLQSECVVAYISNPISMVKCKKSCTSMGAKFFRWFYDQCCECISDKCIDYGLDEAKCQFPHEYL